MKPDSELLADSPDELAIVRGAEYLGFVFDGRDEDVVHLVIDG